MAECTCFELPPEMWTTHYGAVEPGSTHEPNPNCPEHFRKPPFRLADGTWSDGVNRSECLQDRDQTSRVEVWKDMLDGRWYFGDADYIDRRETHAEAIAYADRMARGA